MDGSMKGRTLELQPGPNVIGSAGDCDVMVPGAEVASHHVCVQVGNLVVSVQRIEGAAVRLNGEEMVQTRRSLVAGDVFVVGAVTLQLERGEALTGEIDPLFSEAGVEPLHAARRVDKPRRWSFWLGCLLLVIACAGLVLVAMFRHEREPVVAGIDPTEVARALVAFEEVEVVTGHGGLVLVKGFVESQARKRLLDQAISPFGSKVRSSVYTVDDLIEQARRYLGSAGVGVAYAGHGRLEVTGASDDESLRQRVRRLSEDLYPAVRLFDKVSWRKAVSAASPGDVQAQSAAWQKALPGGLVGIMDSEKGLRSIQLSNGSRYYEGAPLKAGGELVRIEADKIIVNGMSDESRE
ncbi:FHA domain-containing protein [Roseateles sp. NT4]|uniref:FHA domain-containing protein n=1 Tax=Roseateles sp. NT4 TaxID=3453715 RepID=UPI003EED0DF5